MSDAPQVNFHGDEDVAKFHVSLSQSDVRLLLLFTISISINLTSQTVSLLFLLDSRCLFVTMYLIVPLVYLLHSHPLLLLYIYYSLTAGILIHISRMWV